MKYSGFHSLTIRYYSRLSYRNTLEDLHSSSI